ncbi:MAG: hypothetical protein H8D56_05405 [Planctomycetes bacterium]|nr:hypothetical protein [Planctomycetota bacterium]
MDKSLMPLKYAARKYKLPPDWLESEAKRGKLSCLVAGTQIFFNEKLLVSELNKKVCKQTLLKGASNEQ